MACLQIRMSLESAARVQQSIRELVSIPALESEKIMSSAWNSDKTDNRMTLPSNVSYYYF
ncbi:hypothetical protein AB205_0206000 [Aquarana catesbeiana]|uniref:Uncharacterized protein n=1 Tax=Aquarana catesbeiana TaxID=8400 RepID=A0A2G9SA63_AQUCT|nr:hypothetical protein AB205_0206000 [Aquarana catesbeiana]